jgi:hypothetical protein
MTLGVCFATAYGTAEHDWNYLFEYPTGDSDTKLHPVPSNGPNYMSYLGSPNIRAMATKIATKFDHRCLNTVSQDKIP